MPKYCVLAAGTVFVGYFTLFLDGIRVGILNCVLQGLCWARQLFAHYQDCCVVPTTLFIWAYVLAFIFVLQGVCWARKLFAHYQDCAV